MNDYYILGLQRSGTNYMETLLKQNFGANKLNPGARQWKHSISIQRGFNENANSVLIYKNPYTWIESICFRNDVDWIKRQITYPATDRHKLNYLNVGPRKFNIVNLAKTYKHFFDTWLEHVDTHPINSKILKYESLLNKESREQVLSEIQIQFDWERKSDAWINVANGSINQSKQYNDNMAEYYRNMKPANLNKKQIDVLNETITPELITRLGYVIL